MSKTKPAIVKVRNCKCHCSCRRCRFPAQQLFADAVLHFLERSLLGEKEKKTKNKALAAFIAAQETQTARAFQCNDFTSEADQVLVWATAQPRRKWIALYLTLQITGDPPWGELWVWKVGQIDLEGAAITLLHHALLPQSSLDSCCAKCERLNDRGY